MSEHTTPARDAGTSESGCWGRVILLTAAYFCIGIIALAGLATVCTGLILVLNKITAGHGAETIVFGCLLSIALSAAVFTVRSRKPSGPNNSITGGR
jgi:hypothetical protein